MVINMNKDFVNVSVIIPVYNGESTIKRCIKSVLKQTYENINEIIVVDDGSIDCTRDIVNNIAKNDLRIHYIYKKNGGVSSARNIGIKNAHSDYIMFVDCDDEIKMDLVDSLAHAICSYDMAIAGVELYQDNRISKIEADGLYTSIEVINKYGNELPSLLLNGPCSKLYRNSIIKENSILFDENFSLGEDTLFVFQYLKHCNTINFIRNSGYIYYQLGNNSLMTKIRKDAYFNAKKVYGKLTQIVFEICNGEVPVTFKRVYRNVLMVYIRKTIINKKYIEKKYLNDIINDFMQDEIVNDLIYDIKDINFMQKLINKLIEKKDDKMLSFLLKIHVKLRGD